MEEHSLTEEQLRARKEGKVEKPHWTTEEDECLIQYYPKAPREELLKAIPTRNFKNMVYRAGVLGIVRQFYEAETVPSNVAWQDIQVMLEYGVTEDQLWDEEGGKLIAWRWWSMPLGGNHDQIFLAQHPELRRFRVAGRRLHLQHYFRVRQRKT